MSRGLAPRLLALQPLGEAADVDLSPGQTEDQVRRVSRFSINTWLDVPPTPVPAESGQGRNFFGSSAETTTPRRRLTAGPGRRYSSQSLVEGEWLESIRRPRNGKEAVPLAAAITHFEEFMAPASALVLHERLQQVSSRLELDLIELWRLDEESESEVYCTYAFGSEEVVARYPDLLLGHYPYNDICAAYSAELCQQALEADTKFCWHMRSDGDRSLDEVELSTDAVKIAASAEMAVMIQGDSALSSIWLVGFSLKRSAYHPQKIEFARSLLESYTSAFSGVDGRRDMFDGLVEQWSARAHFYFPVGMLQIRYSALPSNGPEDFAGLSLLCRGSRADIFTATLRATGARVVVKMLREDCLEEPLARQEFVVEQGLLARISHPNVVRLLGMGTQPRPFLVLEWLSGGTLTSKLRSQRYFFNRKMSFQEVLENLKELAEALDYMHMRAHPDACILHRDLKPDNIGFDADGTLKVFDLGLCACVHRSKGLSESYSMTPNTGSLRYMAPEVAGKRPYNEKVDVYSFGLLAWQITSLQVPFDGIPAGSFVAAIESGQRPEMKSGWPPLFKDLLTRCWAHLPDDRPSFERIIDDLSDILSGLEKR